MTFTPTNTPTMTATFTPTSTATQTPTATCDSGPSSNFQGTAGTTNVGVTTYLGPGNNYGMAASPLHVAQNSAVTEIDVYAGPTQGYPMLVGIYDDFSGQPNRVLYQATPQTVVTGWNSFPVMNFYLSMGSYWIVVNPQVQQQQFGVVNSSGVTLYETNPGLAPFSTCIPNSTPNCSNYIYEGILPGRFENNFGIHLDTNHTISAYLKLAQTNSLTITPTPSITVVSLPLNNSVQSPMMGWNDWPVFSGNCAGSVTAIESCALSMVNSGLVSAGYTGIALWTWQQTSRSAGHLVPCSGFPSGMTPLATYLHDLGMKLGIGTAVGTLTCDGGSGSWGYETTDMDDFASWGTDYVESDYCSGVLDVMSGYVREAYAISNNSSNRPMGFMTFAGNQSSILNTGFWGSIGNSNRVWGDPTTSWLDYAGYPGYVSVVNAMDASGVTAIPGIYNDPSLLMFGIDYAGTTTPTLTEMQSQFSMFCIQNSPLIFACDPRSMPSSILNILTNPELIAIDQDPLANQGRSIPELTTDGGNCIIYNKILHDANNVLSQIRAVALRNLDSTSQTMSVTFTALGIPAGSYRLRELSGKSDLGVFTDSFACTVVSHGVSVISIMPSTYSTPTPTDTPIATVVPTSCGNSVNTEGKVAGYTASNRWNANAITVTSGSTVFTELNPYYGGSSTAGITEVAAIYAGGSSGPTSLIQQAVNNITTASAGYVPCAMSPYLTITSGGTSIVWLVWQASNSNMWYGGGSNILTAYWSGAWSATAPTTATDPSVISNSFGAYAVTCR